SRWLDSPREAPGRPAPFTARVIKAHFARYRGGSSRDTPAMKMDLVEVWRSLLSADSGCMLTASLRTGWPGVSAGHLPGRHRFSLSPPTAAVESLQPTKPSYLPNSPTSRSSPHSR